MPITGPTSSGSVQLSEDGEELVQHSAFSPTVAGTWGNLPFNSVRGPGRQNWNLALFKQFVFSETRGSKLEFRAEFFNAFNHTEFNNVSNTFTNGDFGAVTSAHDPREIQLRIEAVLLVDVRDPTTPLAEQNTASGVFLVHRFVFDQRVVNVYGAGWSPIS